jgi:hypothetical protein
MFITKKSVSRRQVLRGLGAAISLPLLDAMVPALTALVPAAMSVRRLGFVYIPNGAIMEQWTPSGKGREFEFSPILKPLEPFRNQVLVLTGLSHNVQGSHAAAGAAWLTGIAPKRSIIELDGHVTVDQIAAQHLGQQTQLASLELGLEAPDFAGDCDGGYNCAYTTTVSWRDSVTPLPMETDPRAAFERIFGDGDSTAEPVRSLRLQEDRSILDGVTRDVVILQKALGHGDRSKLTQFLDSIRDVERRIQQTEKQSAETPLPELARPMGVPDRFEDYAKLMFDLQVLAYQCDLTRVMTFMIGKEVSNRTYPEIGVPEPHHATSHHQHDKEKMEKVAKINTLHMQMFAYYLEKLRSTPDGDGTLLDHATILYGAGMSDPNIHSKHDLPAIVAGGGAGHITGGQHLRYPLDTPYTNLFLALLEAIDVPMEKFSDSTGRLDLTAGI